eukprot:scaffold1661_cov251-Pinguiococcus_pyrenoidosus.AAC.55
MVAASEAQEAWQKDGGQARQDAELNSLSQQVKACLERAQHDSRLLRPIIDSLVRIVGAVKPAMVAARAPWMGLAAATGAAQQLMRLEQLPGAREVVRKHHLAHMFVLRLQSELKWLSTLNYSSQHPDLLALRLFLPVVLEAVDSAVTRGDETQVRLLLNMKAIRIIVDATIKVWAAEGVQESERAELVGLLRRLDDDWWKSAAPIWWSSPALLHAP